MAIASISTGALSEANGDPAAVTPISSIDGVIAEVGADEIAAMASTAKDAP